MDSVNPIPVEGQLYKTIHIDEHIFELRYGYNEDYEREHCHPVVLFPDLETEPLHTRDGYPIVTAVQEPCQHYTVPPGQEPEQWCADCIYYPGVHQEMGICSCDKRRKEMKKNLRSKEEAL